MSSFGDFISLSDKCDACTAKLIQREVSDGVIAPGYDDEALEILKTKKKGNYCILQMDPDYVPAPVEHKQVFGVTFEQGRNNVVINASMFENIVTKNHELPDWAKDDMAIAMITLKYTQSNSVCYVKGGQASGARDYMVRPIVDFSSLRYVLLLWNGESGKKAEKLTPEDYRILGLDAEGRPLEEEGRKK